MTDQQHRATPADWHIHEVSLDDADSSCILELRDRIAALEASLGIGQAVTPANTSAPADSLVERVRSAIDRNVCPDQWLHVDAARAAIREVAAWLDDQIEVGAAHLLSEEANH
jgi:hypothetical protein